MVTVQESQASENMICCSTHADLVRVFANADLSRADCPVHTSRQHLTVVVEPHAHINAATTIPERHLAECPRPSPVAEICNAVYHDDHAEPNVTRSPEWLFRQASNIAPVQIVSLQGPVFGCVTSKCFHF